MRYLKMCFMIGCLALMCVSLVPQSKAYDFYKRTSITFADPVELPGIVLPAGTYVFRSGYTYLADHIVQVFNADETQLLATVQSVQRYRRDTNDQPEFTFEERAAGAPQAIKTWFYPGYEYGDEFVYPKNNTSEFANLNPSQGSTAPAETAAAEVNKAQSLEDESSHAGAFAFAEPSENGDSLVETVEPNPPEQSQVAEPEHAQSADSSQMAMNTRLPKTASPLFTLGLAGLLLLAGAQLLRFLSHQMV
jgi:hypothetical protein